MESMAAEKLSSILSADALGAACPSPQSGRQISFKG